MLFLFLFHICLSQNLAKSSYGQSPLWLHKIGGKEKKKKKLIYNSTNHSIDQTQRSMQSCVNVSQLVSH
jgi:hypothetical protein